MTLPITLRYFQYLAALYTEMFLDWYEQEPRGASRFAEQACRQPQHRIAWEAEGVWNGTRTSDLKKLAFWMATGSGKTLLMHLNYRQYLHYNHSERGVGQHPADYAQRGADPAAPGRARMRPASRPGAST